MPAAPERTGAEVNGTLAQVREWLTSVDLPVEPGRRPGELVVQLSGEHRLRTAVSVLVGGHSLSVSAFVLRAPAENADGLHRWLLRRNLRLPGVAFALDELGDVFLVGRLTGVDLPPPSLQRSLDALFGAVLDTVDGSFDELLALGFGEAIRREWAWRLSRGEDTRNLDAFEYLKPE